MLRTIPRTATITRIVARTLWRSSAAHVYGRRSFSSDRGSDVFMQQSNAIYIEEMYEAWAADPTSVDKSWRMYFENLSSGIPASEAFVPQKPPQDIPIASGGVPVSIPGHEIKGNPVINHMKVQLLVRAFQVRGHLKAKLDPLGISFGDDKNKPIPKELTTEYYNFTEEDLKGEVTLGPGILPNFIPHGITEMTIGGVIKECERIYSSNLGIEYVHIMDRGKCDWLRERLEVPQRYDYNKEQKTRILDRLIWSTQFEEFLGTKFPNDKRFGLEGCETMIPGIKSLIDRSVDYGVEDIVIGMPHRGRLNMLSNVIRKPNESIFSEFYGSGAADEGSGDVKYHLGANYQRPTPSGKKVNLSLVANPSHLEAEDPIVLGKTRALQSYKNDEGTFTKAMGVLLHGDAAFAAQGVVYETLGFHSLPAYSTGGTIHVIINNQIGFTTDPRMARSTPYPSDIAKSIEAPILHVNGDDIEAVTFAFELAADWRAKFKSDVIIDVVCYRKHGHNETDQPSFTQPFMYKRIAQKKSSMEMYINKLLAKKIFSQEEVDAIKKGVWQTLETAFKNASDYKPTTSEWLSSAWVGFKTQKELATEILPSFPTAIDEQFARSLITTASKAPEGFNVHRNLQRILKNRVTLLEKDGLIDWATAEAIAFGSLVSEGYQVRIAGQDVERGTFSQRHAVLHDQQTEETYVPLQHVSEGQGKFSILNSSLSEYGAMGFEYGYSLTSPKAFVMWEAQYGDFANTGQVIIDQFVASGEVKWLQMSGLVMSLPHGFDGQASEHSSGRLERYLILGNEDPRTFPNDHKLGRQHQDANMQIVYPTTPANLFHVLRRQMHREFRKPLILFMSKMLLRHPMCRSHITELSGDSKFQFVLEDTEHGKSIPAKDAIKRLIFCSGQVYVTLFKARQENRVNDAAIVRIEELHPLPWQQVLDVIESYPNLDEIVWCQEEPFNAGAWEFIRPRFKTLLQKSSKYSDFVVRYAGRDPCAHVAAGSKVVHKAEEEKFIQDALRF
ncbi:2-oxoglutarate dehydrogenase, mitochondrial [Trichomonascus vanleenenianus]|uniref:2-oxoglutarate dehydrogenase family protein n=1 Tax=Trichomonascus vanleenenianus TaxID=2268995 RepID=UPI003EC9AC24